MIYKVLLVFSIILEAAVVPMFLKEQRYKKTNKSLTLKMICSTLFVLVGVLAINISDSHSKFVKLIMLGLILGWFGDLFLHLRGGAKTYAIGAVSFFAGHLVYAYTYIKLCMEKQSNWNFFVPWRIITVIALVTVTTIVIAINYKKLRKWLILPCILYSVMLSVMVVCSISVALMFSNDENMAFGILLCTGSILFTVSDVIIGILDFGRVKSFSLKCVNIATYFAGQTAIAASIAVIYI